MVRVLASPSVAPRALAVIAILAGSPGLSAQTTWCVTLNSAATLPNTINAAGTVEFLLQDVEIALRVQIPAGPTLRVVGFEVPMSFGYDGVSCTGTSPAPVDAALYFEDPVSGGPVASSVPTTRTTMTVSNSQAWRVATFPWAIDLPGGTVVFISVTHPGAPWCVYLPATAFQGASTGIAWGRASPGAAWQGPNPGAVLGGVNTRFMWRLRCDPSGTLFGSPEIVSQPQALTLCEGLSALFSVSATGNAPLSYQWRRNGADIPGANAPTHSIPAVSTADAGNYRCLVWNAIDSVLSNAAPLAVRTWPEVTLPPQSQTVCTGGAVCFGVTATGTAPLEYQWSRNLTPIQGATGPSWCLTAVSAADQGSYRCRVTNECGSVDSAAATLTVQSPPVITQPPQGQTVCPGAAVCLSVGATGTALSYSWSRNDSPILGAGDPTYCIASALSSHGGAYTVTVSNGCDSVTSAPAILTVHGPPVPVISSTPRCGTAPLTVTFSASSVPPPDTYAWDLDGDGQTDDTTATPAFPYMDPGFYTVSVTVTTCGGTGSRTEIDFVRVHAPAPPLLLQYQFNEVRGDETANTGHPCVSTAPEHGDAGAPGWQAGAGRPRFQAAEAGFGCLGRNPAGPLVNSHWNTSLPAFWTVMWWQRMGPNPPQIQGGGNPTNRRVGFWGIDGGNNAQALKCFTEGEVDGHLAFVAPGGGQGGGPVVTYVSSGDVQAPATNAGVWRHVALVASANSLQWWFDGVPDAGTFALSGTGLPIQTGELLVGGAGDGAPGSSGLPNHNATLWYDVDDFRVYAEARTAAQILQDLAAEAPSASRFDSGCGPAGPWPVPRILANGAPAIPNPHFALLLRDAQPNLDGLLVIGVEAHDWDLGGGQVLTLPISLNGILVGSGCSLGVVPALDPVALVLPMNTGPSGRIDLELPLPDVAFLRGVHFYAQWILFGAVGSATPVLDLNLQ